MNQIHRNDAHERHLEFVNHIHLWYDSDQNNHNYYHTIQMLILEQEKQERKKKEEKSVSRNIRRVRLHSRTKNKIIR